MSHQRREQIVKILTEKDSAVSASWFAKELGVTRQVIVGDVALLRASGVEIAATPRGYLLEKQNSKHFVLACAHDAHDIAEELYTIIECGCGVVDITVEHPLYGQITCNLHIYTKAEADDFLQKLKDSNSRPLLEITNRTHLHRLQCPSEKHFHLLQEALDAKHFLHKE